MPPVTLNETAQYDVVASDIVTLVLAILRFIFLVLVHSYALRGTLNTAVESLGFI